MFRSLVALVFSVLWVIFPAYSTESNNISKELLHYIADAKKDGLEDDQIKRNAVKAGWPAAEVEEAVMNIDDSSGQPSNRTDRTTMPVGVPASLPPVFRQAAPKDHRVPEDYQIGAGDVLQISVWKEPEASVPSVVVRPDGKIGLPLLREVKVADLTPTQVESLITKGLSKFISGADVTVIVSQINSKKVYMVGAVGKVGPIPLLYRMTVLQALSEAGGPTEYAKKKKIYILRTEGPKHYRFKFNYDQVIKGEQMMQNIPLMPNDTIVVPQ